MLSQQRTGKLVFGVFSSFSFHRQVPSTIVRGWVPVSGTAAKGLPGSVAQDLSPAVGDGNSLDTEGVATAGTDGRLPLFRLRSIGNERLQTELCTPLESASVAHLDVVRRA